MIHCLYKSLLITLLLGLAGCSALSFLRLNTAGYDAGEYLKAVTFAATLQQSDCSATNVKDLQSQMTALQIYSTGVPGNKLIVLIENQMLKTTNELAKHSQPISQTYCADKLAILRREAASLVQLEGAKSR